MKDTRTKYDKLLAAFLLFLMAVALGFLLVMTAPKAHGETTKTPTAPTPTVSVYMNQVYAWAAGRQVTITRRGPNIWIEVTGADEFGTGPTVEAAAQNFMESVDLMEHESNVPNP